MNTTFNSNPEFDFNRYWMGLVIGLLLILALMFTISATAQTKNDTIPCNVECIKDYVVTVTDKGTKKVYAIYDDDAYDIHDLIPVSNSTYDYILRCKDNHIQPNLGIKFRNGQISSLCRYKHTYLVVKRRRLSCRN